MGMLKVFTSGLRQGAKWKRVLLEIPVLQLLFPTLAFAANVVLVLYRTVDEGPHRWNQDAQRPASVSVRPRQAV